MRYHLYDPQGNYQGPFGAATKHLIYDITAAPLDQSVFSMEKSWDKVFQEGATSWTTDGARGYRKERDMNMDLKNPRQELPKDRAGLLAMDTIPNLIEQKIDMSHPADYEASTAVQMFQMSEMYSKAQDTLFTDPKSMENPQLRQEGPNTGKPQQGISQLDAYGMEGSAAGRINNFLWMDEDGAYLWSTESTVAF